MQLRDEFMELPLFEEEAPGDEFNRPRDDAYASNGMYPPPHMTCMYLPPHMTCMYPPPHMTCMYPPPHMMSTLPMVGAGYP